MIVIERGGTRRSVLAIVLFIPISEIKADDWRARRPPPESAAPATQPAAPSSAPTTQSTEPGAHVGAPESQPATQPTAKPRGPKYLRLRYDEDYSYLDGPPGSYVHDFFDPIKWIRLSDDLHLSIGGDFRFRMEAESDKDYDTNERGNDTFQLYKYLLHFDLRYRKTARLYVEGLSAFLEDRQLTGRANDEDHWDMEQLFFDVRPFGDATPLTLRVGRQEMNYGAGRLVDATNWGNVRNRFDAAKLMYETGTWSFDLFYAKHVDVRRQRPDRWHRQDFYGAYFTYKGIPRHGIDLYFFALDDTGNRRNPNNWAGDVARYTLGSRFWGKTAGFDYETELFGQWGLWAHDTIQAWNWSIVGGYTFEKMPTTPRFAAGFDLVTGDRNPNDRSVQTADRLYGSTHSYFGYLDLIGRANITDVIVELSAWPVKDKVKTSVTYYGFWLTQRRDALYDTGGRASRRDPAGLSGREVGKEMDLTIEWNIDVHSSLLLGWSHFWDGDFIKRTGRDKDPDFYYIHYAFKF